MDDPAYRDFLRATFGVETSKVLQQKEFEILMREMKRMGFEAVRGDGSEIDDPTPPGMMTNQQRWKMARLLKALGIAPDSPRARGILRQSGGPDSVAWLTKTSAKKFIDALRDVARREGHDAPYSEAPPAGRGPTSRAESLPQASAPPPARNNTSTGYP
ncbi:MAG TPA: phage protein GemA/Gp16 family protein [Sumerlaeia bacterium]|nr:phage protein GemA/Gp16 family protein [Sumerlaeia bacterium]